MKILTFAKNGQLGWELQRTLACLGQVIALDYPGVDFSKPQSIKDIVKQVKPDLLVNPAAYTAVDKAESQREIAYLVNSDSVAVLAEEAYTLRIPFIHYSTDYVFNGRKGSPYVETDEPDPLSVYGSSKLAGEQAVLQVGGAGIVLRTSWVYSLRKGGFVSKVLQWAREQEVMRIVDDQISGPTSARMLAEATALMIAKADKNPYDFFAERSGLYHLAGEGACSRYEWAKAIIVMDPKKEEQKVKEILTAKSDEFPNPAVRPMESVLCCDKFEHMFGLRLPDWEEAQRLEMEKLQNHFIIKD